MNKPKLILFDANPLMGNRTGVGYYTTQLIRSLAAEHPDVKFMGYYYNFLGRKQPPKDPLAANIAYRPIYHIPGPIINLFRRCRIEVPIELLALTNPDFVLYPNFLNHPTLFRTPSANVIHDMTFVDTPEYVARKNLQDLLRFVPTQIKRSSFIVTVSEFGKQRIHEEFGIPTNDILVTPIPPEQARKQNEAKERRLLQKLGIHGRFILTLGTIEPRKNVPNMVEAYLQLPQKLQQEYTFVIAGKIGWNCDREIALLKQVKLENKNILHVGYVDEDQRAALYRNASLFTWASHYEGFGMPVLEAMSYGTPCAISNIPVFKEVAEDTALYFDQNKPAEIAKAWQKLVSDKTLHDVLAKASKKRADSYQWSEVSEDLYQRITAVLKERTK